MDKHAIKGILQEIYLEDKEFSEAFEKIDDAINKESNALIKYNLQTVKEDGCEWVDYKHRLAYSNETMMDVYNAVKEEGISFKHALETGINSNQTEGN